ncbi:DNA primase [Antarcticirhabdus aurantiaca]|uniref:DNA primase n=1 Tax=Antarcticirhabdus aurantiaca TaxID=2606717 RepID=A0ACD4NXM0_9HYPH|nr:DNA primase [Antarcticirhabdus aurantiaca]WAJ31479.1 DNA primase [Jeongeuplla avenae]
MRFAPSFLDDIRDRVKISDVIGRRVTWDRRKTQPGKGDYWACCPFHGERSPSFHCEDVKGRYHCFGCGVSGDVFRFLTDCEGMAFPEAVERLAAEAGLPMPARDPEAEKREAQRATIFDALRIAADFFRAQLQEGDGAKARAYLRDRGLSPATQAVFGIGYAPESRNRLKEHLVSKGVGKAEIEAAGLVIHENVAVSYDRFRDRIIFPILDTRERVIAFGGRAMSADAQAKYLNSPETEVFVKGSTLFNIARARRAARQTGTLLVVEGYVDAIMLHQYGFEHAVAPLGTALTDRQLELLWKSVPEPILCFDGDAAGTKAAHRAAEVALPLLKPGQSLRFVMLPTGKDPDDVVRDGGAEAFNRVLEGARPLADLLWMRETAGASFDTPERRADLEKRLKSLVRQVGDESVRRHYLQDVDERLSAFFGAPAAGNQRRDGGFNRNDRGGGGGWKKNGGQGGHGPGGAGRRAAVSDRLARSSLTRTESATATAAPSRRETTIVVGFINHPVLFEEAFDYFAGLELADATLERLRSVVLDVYAEEAPRDRDDLLSALQRRGAIGLFDEAETRMRLVREWSVLADAAPEDAREAVRQALHLQHRFRSLHRELKQAEEQLGTEPTELTLQHMLEVKREIEDATAIEALIEGYGILSGRGAKAI